MSDVLKFIQRIHSDCELNGFTLELINNNYVDLGDDKESSGYFDETEKKICVAMRCVDPIGVLAHEYNHFKQYIEAPVFYQHCSKSYQKVFDWLDGKRVNNISEHIATATMLELDCEKRTVEMIKNFNLNIDIKLYIRQANAYIYFWQYIFYTRKWCDMNNTPSSNIKIVSSMPARFLNDYTITDKIKELFDKEKI